MKSRSHRLPVLEPHKDDWGDGSWTVDCICGVNFDDGEEMVNCDECGVWVHTRCSRYVKSERSFACDKCKSKDVGGSTRNANEETEVAEFLVELPTKTLRMDNPSSLFNDQNEADVSSGKPCRLWVPMEERVHVQGVPGGEPGLFSGSGMSSIFGPELWKATGYVPKKFNFRYNEFPQWDDDKTSEENGKEVDRGKDEGTTIHADNGAGALLSLSKNCGNGLPSPVVDSVGVKSPDEDEDCHEIVSPRHRKKLSRKCLTGSEDSSKKKSSSKQSILLYSGKRKKEELGMSKDQGFKKRARALEQEEDVNKQTARASRSDGGSKISSDVLADDKPSDGLGECATNLASNECGPEATLRNNVSTNNISSGRNRGDHAPGRFDHFSKGRRSVAAALDSARKTPANEEASGNDLQSCGNVGGAGSIGVESHDKELAADVTVTGPDANGRGNGQDLNADEANSRPIKKLKAGVDAADDSGSLPVQSFPPDDVKLDTAKEPAHSLELSADLSKEDCKVNLTSVIKSEASEHKLHDGSRIQVVTTYKTDKSNGTPETDGQSKLDRTGSGGSVGAKKQPSGRTDNSEVAEESPRSNSAVTPALYHRKVVVSVGKSASTSISNGPKSSINRTATSAQKPSSDKQKESAGSCVRTMKNSSSIETDKDDNKHGPLKKLLKESSRLNTESKVSNVTKPSSTSDSKRMSSDLKDFRVHSSSKAPVVSSTGATPSESAGLQQVDSASNVLNKDTIPAVHIKGEKFHQSGSHPSSRGNAPSMNAPAAALSDEELALLLHQELNSSPRVPRASRMRNAGSLPQFPGATGTSMLMKRTSSNGGKDHIMTSRRKNKDSSRDGSHGPPEADDEPKKTDRKPPSPDKRKRDSGIDRVSKRKADGGALFTKTTIVSSSLSSSSDEANIQNLPSSRLSSRVIPDDDSRVVGRKETRTLPGLLAEIMREGKRMTYEELCNSVLPHWPHLRKHNGERYAYSSHSQAVLDCLRNRSEWARLVDRGPKTTTTRKRRKTDHDSVSFESEDEEDNTKDVGTKSFESHQEDVIPKGKRKARKGRRLALQGRGVVRRRRADVVSDDESESPSNSGEDDVNSSEEEIRAGANSRSEASASSDED